MRKLSVLIIVKFILFTLERKEMSFLVLRDSAQARGISRLLTKFFLNPLAVVLNHILEQNL